MGVASAVLNSSQQVGGTLGLAVLVTVAAAATRSALGSGTAQSTLTATVHGYSVAFVVASGMAFAAFLVALAAIRTPDGPPAPS
jgi:predicted transcriptional regulator